MGNDVKCSKGDKYNTIYTSISAQAKNKIEVNLDIFLKYHS